MSVTADLTTNSVYTITLYPKVLYGNEMKDLTFKARLTSDLAVMYGVVPDEEHRKVYSTLPNGVIDDASAYDWLVFKTLGGDTVVVGEPWIKTVEGGEASIQYLVRVTGDSKTPARITNALASINIHDFSIETVRA